jgi:hypothetical protein
VLRMPQTTLDMKRPEYLALDNQGFEYQRLALVISELPLEDRSPALLEATTVIAAKLGLTAAKPIPFGAPMFTAFEGMTRPKAKHHAQVKLLLTLGADVSLDYCPGYDPLVQSLK